MAVRLDQMLEPGERVVHRDPRSLLPVAWHVHLAILLAAAGAFLAFDLGSNEAVYFVIPLVVWTFSAYASYRTEAVVTDRRVLRRAGGRNSEITEIPLAEVTGVRYRTDDYPGNVEVTTRYDVNRVEFNFLRQPQGFAAALAKAADLGRPILIGPLIHIAPYIYLFGGLPFAALLIWGLYNLSCGFPPIAFFGPTAAPWILVAILGLPTFLVGVVVGGNLVGLAGYALLRPWVTLQEAQNSIILSGETGRGNWLSRQIDQIYVAWIGVLYGGPVSLESKGGGSHGG